MRNSSLITADSATHLKIVVVALLASVTVMIVGIAARPQVDNGMTVQVIKASPSQLATGAEATAIRLFLVEPSRPGRAFGRAFFWGKSLGGNVAWGGPPGGAQGDGGTDSTSLPANSTGPVGAPVGEPPAGSS